MYFFHKFVLDDIAIDTAIYVFVPFAVFFLFSLFMVYLEKPVIKKVSKEEYQKKRLIRSAVDGSAGAASRPDERRGYHEEDDYIPRGSHRPGPDGPSPEPPRQGVVNQAAFSRAKIQAAVENTQQSQRLAYPRHTAQPQQRAARPASAESQAVRAQPQSRVQQPRPSVPRQSQPVAQRKIPNRPADPRQAANRPAGSMSAAAQNGAYAGRYRNQEYTQRGPQGQGTASRRDVE